MCLCCWKPLQNVPLLLHHMQLILPSAASRAASHGLPHLYHNTQDTVSPHLPLLLSLPSAASVGSQYSPPVCARDPWPAPSSSPSSVSLAHATGSVCALLCEMVGTLGTQRHISVWKISIHIHTCSLRPCIEFLTNTYSPMGKTTQWT
jgi:hypothetical protein